MVLSMIGVHVSSGLLQAVFTAVAAVVGLYEVWRDEHPTNAVNTEAPTQ